MIATTFLVTIASCGLILVTTHGDTISIERQVREAKVAVMASVDELARSQEIAAVWDTSVVELRKPLLDRQWMDDNIGNWLYKMFSHDQVYILNSQDQPIYASIAGRRSDPNRFSSISGTVNHFVQAVRGRIVDQSNVHERLPGVPLNSKSTVRTGSAAIHATELAWINERPAAISVMRMVPHTKAVQSTPGQEPLLISVRYLDGNLLDELKTRNLLTGARISPSMGSGRGVTSFALESDHGLVGYFSWKPELPGSELRGYLAVVLGGFTLLMALIMGLLAHSLHKAMWEQHQVKSAGCNVMQGHLFSRAVPEADLAHFVRDRVNRRNAA